MLSIDDRPPIGYPQARKPLRAAAMALVATALVQVSSPSRLLAHEAEASAERSVAYLAARMDLYHVRFPVYDDVSSAGNHFPVFTKIPDARAPVTVDGSWAQDPFYGATAIRCELVDEPGPTFGGFYFLNGVLPEGETTPQPNFGTHPDAGIDLSGATALRFWARGETGGERVEIFLGGVGRDPATGEPRADAPYPGSSPRHPAQGTLFTLTREWQEYVIDVRDLDLSYLLGGFGWVADDGRNPGGAVFYLDAIEYVLSPEARERRLQEPRFIASYETAPVQPDPFDDDTGDDIDLVHRNMAFSYDNALAILAFLADGSPDSVRRARLIGDAFLYAMDHDRSYDGGEIRTGYAAGDLALPPGWTPGGREGTVAIPGFYYEPTQTFFETGQEALDTGNHAWVMVALLALQRVTDDGDYLDGARRIASGVECFRQTSGTYRGYTGGLDAPESPEPRTRPWASAEHNLDLVAAFRGLHEMTGSSLWLERAAHARELVDALWDPAIACYRAGTLDPETLNRTPGQLPVDVQAWSVLALPQAHERGVLACAETHHRTTDRGFSGMDFNDDRDGVWFEGTGQMAAAYAVAGRDAAAGPLRRELRRAQASDLFGPNGGLVAASRDGLTTGFGFRYYRRGHVGATSWNVFAQLGFNPYYEPAGPATPVPPPGPWLETGELPGFRVKVRIAQRNGSILGSAEADCIPETLCVSGAVPGRSEVFVRIVGPKGNGYLWPTLVKFSTSTLEIWIEQLSSGEVRYYRLPGATPGSSELPGLFDRRGFRP